MVILFDRKGGGVRVQVRGNFHILTSKTNTLLRGGGVKPPGSATVGVGSSDYPDPPPAAGYGGGGRRRPIYRVYMERNLCNSEGRI